MTDTNCWDSLLPDICQTPVSGRDTAANAMVPKILLAILTQRGNPALPVSDGCSDWSEPKNEQGGRESRNLHATTAQTVA